MVWGRKLYINLFGQKTNPIDIFFALTMNGRIPGLELKLRTDETE